MTHFIGGPMHGVYVPSNKHSAYRIMIGVVHYIRRVDSTGRVDFAIYGMNDANVQQLLAEIYSTEDV